MTVNPVLVKENVQNIKMVYVFWKMVFQNVYVKMELEIIQTATMNAVV